MEIESSRTAPSRSAAGPSRIAHLRDRADALVRVGWPRREAEWLALVCRHSGVFLRSQYLAFIGRTNPALAHRFVRRCRQYAVEEPCAGSRLRVCRIASRTLHELLGAEHARHRRLASPEVVLRRLLSLDYILEHPHAAWLPTDDEKVNAMTAAGIAREVLPCRLYRGALDGLFRYFPHNLPVAADDERATFVFVLVEDETESAVRRWGLQHAALWTALAAAGRTVEVVVVGRDPVRLAAAGRVVDRWTREPVAPAAEREETAARLCEQARREEELESIRAALVAGNSSALRRYGDVNGALARMRELATAETAGTVRAKPAITTGRTWRSRRVPEGWLTRAA
ncbi:MAG: hypothetical protein OXH75_16365 [Acidobacteria bacterium]|nr:hypothetical protein [Acidobacteriota bacterium]